MKGFKANIGLPIPNYTDVFKLLDEANIFAYYVPNLEFNTSIKSPLGEPDNKPSFSVFWSYRKHKFIFKEHRYGYIGDCVDFVRYYFGYKNNTKACMKIFNDFGITGFKIDDDIDRKVITDHTKIQVDVLSKRRQSAKIKVTVRDWEKYDLDYWAKYGLNKQWLKFGGIYPISFYYITQYGYTDIRKADKYAYVYVEHKDSKVTYKIYQPFNKVGLKWRSNNNNSIWELWNCLPQTYDFLIITKSRKDALSIMATADIPATSLQAEGTIPKPQVIKELKERFKNIFLLYDNDYDADENWGQGYSKKLSKKFELPDIFIPDKFESKDYTDFIIKYSIKEAKYMLWNLIKKKLMRI